jgi:formamidopyrimidine-DNA glycosylase
MPELPEVEITARRLSDALAGEAVVSALAPGINALKTFDPPLQALEGRRVERIRRIGKHLVIDLDEDLHVLLHLMSAGRLQLYPKRASLRDKTSRLLLRFDGDRELRLREFGTRQAAWVKVLRGDALLADDAVATLGPEAWPDPPADLRELLAAQGARPLHAGPARPARHRRDRALLGGRDPVERAPVAVQARRRPRRGDGRRAAVRDLRAPGRRAGPLRGGGEAAHPGQAAAPLQVHRHEGQPCPRCGTTLEAVHYESYVMAYCPTDQTGGKVLKDRRLSRLLK